MVNKNMMRKTHSGMKTISLTSLTVIILTIVFHSLGAKASSSSGQCISGDDSDHCSANAVDEKSNAKLKKLYEIRDKIGQDILNENDSKKKDKLTKKWNEAAREVAILGAEIRHGKVEPGKHRLLTQEDINKFDGSDENLPIYLVIVGEVFDVSRGKGFYGEGAGYNAFAGRDGSRAFITGEFNDDGSVPDFDGLTLSQIQGIEGWREFYHKDYTYVGKLIGFYWGSDGNPTKEKLEYDEKLKLAAIEKEKKKALDKLYPGCNSRWSQSDGGEVWCSKKSGGVDRDWIGVPRLWHQKREDGSTGYKKCVCVDLTKLPPARKNSKGEDVYKLDAGMPMVLQVYKSCIRTPKAHRCKT